MSPEDYDLQLIKRRVLQIAQGILVALLFIGYLLIRFLEINRYLVMGVFFGIFVIGLIAVKLIQKRIERKFNEERERNQSDD